MTPPAVGDTLWQMLPSLDPSTLQAFLADPARPADTLRYHELQGFLFAVTSAPELILPSEWQPIIFGDQEVEYASLDEAQEIVGQITALYNAINAAVIDAPTLLPADCQLRDDVLANFEDDAPIAQWSSGFLRGHQWLEKLWEDLPDDVVEELDATLMILAFFSSRPMAEDYLAEDGPAEQPFEVAAATIHEALPRAVAQYAHIGRSIATVLEGREADMQEPAQSTKVGRNALCPCGSGKKYKHCCGVTVH